jgi:hypothetical protein
VQPAAEATNLVLFSPTLDAKTQGTEWFAAFLKERSFIKDHADHPSDADLIKTFAIHQYDCREWIWKNWYRG